MHRRPWEQVTYDEHAEVWKVGGVVWIELLVREWGYLPVLLNDAREAKYLGVCQSAQEPPDTVAEVFIGFPQEGGRLLSHRV